MRARRQLETQRSRRRQVAPFLVAGLLLVTVLSVAPHFAHGDASVAQFLLKEGKRAISLRKWDEAIVKLTRAREEDPTLIEATYLAATAHEKKKDPAGALAAYRSFRDACVEREREGDLDRKLKGLRKKAQARIDVLGKGEKELEKLQAAFARSMRAFATDAQSDDPEIAQYALRRVLAVLPLDKEATALLDKMTGESSTGGGDSPIPGISTWDDLLKRKSVETGKSISYSRGTLKIDSEGGSVYWHDGRTEAPGTFVYEVEFRFVREHRAGYLLGLTFARSRPGDGGPESFVMAFAQKSNLNLVQAKGGRNVDLSETAIPPVPLGTWRRLVVAVDGRKVRVFLDGEKLLTATVPGVKDLTGLVGVFHQRCEVEVRGLRLGTKR